MKYNIFRYNQKIALHYGLDLVDLLILTWIQDFFQSPKIVKEIINNKEYGWLKYEYLMEEIPIIGISTKNGLYKRLKVLSNKGFLENETVTNKKGTFSYFRIGNKVFELLTENNDFEKSKNNSQNGLTKIRGGSSQNQRGGLTKSKTII